MSNPSSTGKSGSLPPQSPGTRPRSALSTPLSTPRRRQALLISQSTANAARKEEISKQEISKQEISKRGISKEEGKISSVVNALLAPRRSKR